MNQVLIADPSKCTACRSCEAACSTFREGETNISKSRVKVTLFYNEGFFYPNVCLQCAVPYCALSCPTAALSKNEETGVVEYSRQKCIGCKLCMVACPFGAITLVDGFPIKCDTCNGDPMCVRFCEPKALSYVEAGDIGLGQRVLVAQRMKGAYQAASAAAS